MTSLPFSPFPASIEEIPLKSPEKEACQAFLKHFVDQWAQRPGTLSFVAGDASPRRYYRWTPLSADQYPSVIVMVAPPSESLTSFCQVATLLQSYGLSAPHIYAVEEGRMILEDFGDQTLQRILSPQTEKEWGEMAIDVLLHLARQTERPAFLPRYTPADMEKELEIFLQWYVPVSSKRDRPLASFVPADTVAAFRHLWREALVWACAQQPEGIVLRDFHVDNLMCLSRPSVQKCGLLDFQDAVWGPVGYDLVSFLEDARRDWPLPLRNQLESRYEDCFFSSDFLALRPYLPPHGLGNRETFRRSNAILSAGRHLKILGIFWRLALRDGKTDYLRHLPRVRGHLQGCLSRFPAESPLPQWMNQKMGFLWEEI